MEASAIYRRAGARRHYNLVRHLKQTLRRKEVMRLLSCQGALFRRGIQTELARELGVSRSTICRDIAYLLRLGWPCPHCGAYTQPPEPLFMDDSEEEGEVSDAMMD
ncbi:MAG TPA: HTH domain-containing protein [Gemmataceae bacterium]|nr:HTH domain-containing protein [Gemmataceae bacterium]